MPSVDMNVMIQLSKLSVDVLTKVMYEYNVP